MNSRYVLISVIVCAFCTQVTRWLPFLLFGGKKELPKLVRYLGVVLPAAIMAVLVVYCLKGITPPGLSLRTAGASQRSPGGGSPCLEGEYPS